MLMLALMRFLHSSRWIFSLALVINNLVLFVIFLFQVEFFTCFGDQQSCVICDYFLFLVGFFTCFSDQQSCVICEYFSYR